MNSLINIVETTYTHISGTDGLPLRVLRIEPTDPGSIRGIVQMVHGKNEHKGRYAPFMRYLAANGYLTICNDHRGHGESVNRPQDRGYMYEGGYKALVEDVHEITLEVKDYADKRCGGKALPMILLGHSMGSLAARCYIRKYDDEIDKLLLIGSPSKSKNIKQGLMMLRSLEHIEGKRARSKLADLLIIGVNYEFKFRKEGLKNAWTNSEREAVIEHNNDPLCRFRFTLSGYEEMLKMSMLTYSGGYTPKNPHMPIRFFSGANDPCAISKERFIGALHLLKKIGYTNVRGKMYNGMRHDILHEKEKHKVYCDILKAIEE